MRRAIALVAMSVTATSLLWPTPATPQPAPSRVRIAAPAGGSILVHGEYPPTESSCVDPYQPVLHARYRGVIEVLRASDGSLSLIGELPFEDYLKGIAEVPRDWPMEALKAQVVAARTYALSRLESGSPSSEYDLCATTECQVYVGMQVEAGPWGDRWVRAVEETAGQALLYEGAPAVTFYSSTSPGHTFDNEDVFGGEPLPYLRGVPEPDDRASPVARWRVEMPLDDVARFLAAGGQWGGGPIREVTASGGTITFAGAGRAALSKDDLRDVLNEQASCRAPDRYPTEEPDGYQLPQTVPSDWYRAQQEGGNLVLVGRGWGHGVGMVQWGAYGKAKRGLAYDEILAAYYGGLRPQAVEGPGTFRVLAAEGLREITIVPSGEPAVEGVGETAPPWTITGGRRLQVRHSPPPDPLLEATAFRPTPTATAGSPYRAAVTLSDDANVRLELDGVGPLTRTEAIPAEEGRARLEIPLPQLEPGRYDVRAVVDDGVDLVSTDAVAVDVVEPSPSPPPPASPTEAAQPPAVEEDARRFPVIPTIGVITAVLVLLVLAFGRRKGLHRQP
ncbi:MAG TPA: SpoIID/LytB domain-containing protein [Actinomycetota bacterium]|nr:SpoIID/LytB domain-containing protein [Actinomycetota bacterium]